jgi:hypothetical protein
MTRGEKIAAFIVAVFFVGCVAFETSMALAIAHMAPLDTCATCASSGGGGTF